ncbi:MAG: serine/threonine protein phosphatase [Candidatus Dactylopiibacterium carminicum]|uniref:Serine/threonine-protein phosphatase n=1 Tax=Candidatus Dactylopiibacterium carminicum TaxID=857335 RepID=A0A272EME2_9RHOO|nr:protein phosphatase 2C domain-containing protein [Candidatus Dactylopiibacterium carminicum]KAF7597655.1 serine/threonine-protein phosphatase [Candidatus Dactylopiibacterium carminicum]PAS91277.1 MAG: serine/threonine protein phosphatase [Candidatus Dactylopiibacterium carminicum]PAS91883.1 MAG: serine/threonine protein phosphatase [Candidatus Dactylopiibacterium carminicum]PAS93347.1 MAG: serine/threonine protein phosphatase [Candidatus Dactylopiibacterium carminicum]
MPFAIDTCAAMHIGDRSDQQDRVAILPHPTRNDCLIAVLADGMGGHSGGAIAAQQVILKAKQNFASFSPGTESTREFLKGVIEEAHVVIKLTRFTSEADPHSTAVVMVMRPGAVEWAHCGDSRLYHFRRGKFVCHTQDHSLVAELIRTRRITEEMAQHHPQRSLLLSCLGAETDPNIDYGELNALEPGDSFLLCSDGLWGLLEADEIARALHELDARSAARVLINAARERGEGVGDNISLAIVKIKPA